MRALVFTGSLCAALLASAKAIKFAVGSCEDLANVDTDRVSTLVITSSAIHCDVYTRFPVTTAVILKSMLDVTHTTFINLSFDVRPAGKLRVQPFLVFLSDGQEQDVDGGALRISKRGKVVFKSDAGFAYFFVTREGLKPRRGGAIFNEGELTIEGQSFFVGNQAGRGGGVFNRGKIVLRDVLCQENWAMRGGGIYNSGRFRASVVGVWGNSAQNSGGAVTNKGRMEFTEAARFSGNTANKGDGGAIHNLGSVIFSGEETTSFSANSAAGVGGAVSNIRGVLTLGVSTTFEENASGISGSVVYNDEHSTTELPPGGGMSFHNNDLYPDDLANDDNAANPDGPVPHDLHRAIRR